MWGDETKIRAVGRRCIEASRDGGENEGCQAFRRNSREENNIGALLRNVLEQPLSGAVIERVIVVMSGCTDRTAEIVEQVARDDPRVCMICEEERRGKASAVNLILRASRGCDILIMLSADNLPAAGSVEELIKPFLHAPSSSAAASENGECGGKRDDAVSAANALDGKIPRRVGCVSGRPVPVNDRRTFFGFASHLGDASQDFNAISKAHGRILCDARRHR